MLRTIANVVKLYFTQHQKAVCGGDIGSRGSGGEKAPDGMVGGEASWYCRPTRERDQFSISEGAASPEVER